MLIEISQLKSAYVRIGLFDVGIGYTVITSHTGDTGYDVMRETFVLLTLERHKTSQMTVSSKTTKLQTSKERSFSEDLQIKRVQQDYMFNIYSETILYEARLQWQYKTNQIT